MASKKTEATELALAFGLLGIEDPEDVKSQQLEILFEGTLTPEKYFDFIDSYEHTYNQICGRMISVGLQVRNSHPYVKNYSSLKWIGEQQLYITTSLSKDLQIGPIAVSAKASSDVVANLSPYNLLIALPSGQTTSSKSQNWFLSVAENELQSLYEKYQQFCFPDQPNNVESFFNQTTQDERKNLVRKANLLDEEKSRALTYSYLRLCHKTASQSASLFNQNLNAAIRTNRARGVKIGIIKTFFRLNTSPYILAGVDRGADIALNIPDSNSWNKTWEFISVEAYPDTNAGQAIVKFLAKIRNREMKTNHEFHFHAEIRWSHGKLCGNPEGKLYKDFDWVELPFIENLLST